MNPANIEDLIRLPEETAVQTWFDRVNDVVLRRLLVVLGLGAVIGLIRFSVERQFLPAPVSQAEIIRLPETENSVHGISEKQKILFSLEKHRWKKHDVATDLGLSRTTLWRKMKQHGLAE